MSRPRRLADAATAVRRAGGLLAHDRWSRARLAAHQRAGLTALVRHATAHSAFYREHYAGVDTDREVSLDRLPPVDKATVMDRFDDLVTDPRLRLADVEAHLAGLADDALCLGRYRVVATGGTTGRRGVFVADRDEWRTYLAGQLRTNAYLGLRPGLPRRRVATVAAGRPAHVTYRMSRSLDVGVHRVLRLAATDPLPALVARLNAFRPEFLYGYPSVLALLAVEQLAGRLRISPATIASSGETHTAETVHIVRSGWDVPWFQIYGTTELPVLGAHCDRHSGLHLFEDLAIVEVVDEHDRPVPPGRPGHRLLVTNLVARTQPLIRYAVTDLVTLAAEPCPCGRPYAVLSSVDGRGDEVLRLPGARGHPVAVHPLALRGPLATVPGLVQYRIVHEGRRLTVRAALHADAAPAPAAAAIAGGLRAALAGLGVAGVEVDVELVPHLDDGRDAAGKLRVIESRS